jgi:hypothetical protein
MNQDDLKERNHQIRHMASVYFIAQYTVIWIGEGTLEMDEFFKNLKFLSSHRLTRR